MHPLPCSNSMHSNSMHSNSMHSNSTRPIPSWSPIWCPLDWSRNAVYAPSYDPYFEYAPDPYYGYAYDPTIDAESSNQQKRECAPACDEEERGCKKHCENQPTSDKKKKCKEQCSDEKSDCKAGCKAVVQKDTEERKGALGSRLEGKGEGTKAAAKRCTQKGRVWDDSRPSGQKCRKKEKSDWTSNVAEGGKRCESHLLTYKDKCVSRTTCRDFGGKISGNKCDLSGPCPSGKKRDAAGECVNVDPDTLPGFKYPSRTTKGKKTYGKSVGSGGSGGRAVGSRKKRKSSPAPPAPPAPNDKSSCNAAGKLWEKGRGRCISKGDCDGMRAEERDGECACPLGVAWDGSKCGLPKSVGGYGRVRW